jgi:hypothetical protein
MIILIAFHDANIDAPVVLNVAVIDHVAELHRGLLTFRVKDDSFSYPMKIGDYLKRIAAAAATRNPVTILEL